MGSSMYPMMHSVLASSKHQLTNLVPFYIKEDVFVFFQVLAYLTLVRPRMTFHIRKENISLYSSLCSVLDLKKNIHLM